MTVRDLVSAALAALQAHADLRARLHSEAYAHLQPQHRANLLGEAPAWANYVARLGQPSRLVAPAQLVEKFGTPERIRAFALGCLAVADDLEAQQKKEVTT